MPIAVICPNCAARLNAPDEANGKTLKCPRCKASSTVPHSLAEAAGSELSEVSAPASDGRQAPELLAIKDDYQESEGLSSIAILLIVVGVISTVVGLVMETAVATQGTGSVQNLGLLAARGLAVTGGLATIGLGILVKILAVLQAFVLLYRRRG